MIDGGEDNEHDRPWEPPAGLVRAAGGLLGVLGGESQGWAIQGCAPQDAIHRDSPHGPVAEALVDLAHGYVDQVGDVPRAVPLDVAERHPGTTAPAWLLSVAVVRPARCDLVADTLELATAAGVPRHSLPACVAYVELAASLFAGVPVESAIRSAVGASGLDRDGRRDEPPLCGESTVDALRAGVWALRQPGGLDDVLPTVGALSTPGVGAAVAGLLGLRDGCGALPPLWHRRSPRANECFALAPGLVRARGTGSSGHAGTPSRLSRTGDVPSEAVESGRVEPRWADAGGTVMPTGSTGSARPEDVGDGAGPGQGSGRGVGVDVASVVAAYAVTEEIEAIEERFPAEAAEGVAEPTVRAAAVRPSYHGRVACGQRQLEGAGQR